MKTTLVLSLLFCVGLTVYAQRTHEPEPEPDNEFACDSCITFATVIKDYVDQRLPLDEVERDADVLCNILPGELRDFCDHNLLPKTDRIFEELHKRTPQEVCEHLDFC